MTTNPLCPACHGKTTFLAGESREALDRVWNLARCVACGTSFTFPKPDDATLQEVYRSCFSYEWYRDHYAAKKRDACQRLEEYRSVLGKHVLDFGGGVGYFSEVARAAGYDSTTYDPFTTAVAAAPASWDTVVALHVLEHANDLDRICRQMKAFLVPGGRLLLAVPNFSGRGYREVGMQWVWAQPPLIHLFHFTAVGLRALLTRHGFVDIQVSYHERWDANNHCDVTHARLYRISGALWGMPLLRRIPAYRRLIAMGNSRLRFHGLCRSLARPPANRAEYSELQVTATLPRT
ncbi:MAG: class I SAM-dependent methyltransferase [Candidatus Accumulibacter sp.]|nr:class I SAM-dependent methyltransferase [Accumulibacter sp.]